MDIDVPHASTHTTKVKVDTPKIDAHAHVHSPPISATIPSANVQSTVHLPPPSVHVQTSSSPSVKPNFGAPKVEANVKVSGKSDLSLNKGVPKVEPPKIDSHGNISVQASVSKPEVGGKIKIQGSFKNKSHGDKSSSSSSSSSDEDKKKGGISVKSPKIEVGLPQTKSPQAEVKISTPKIEVGLPQAKSPQAEVKVSSPKVEIKAEIGGGVKVQHHEIARATFGANTPSPPSPSVPKQQVNVQASLQTNIPRGHANVQLPHGHGKSKSSSSSSSSSEGEGKGKKRGISIGGKIDISVKSPSSKDLKAGGKVLVILFCQSLLLTVV